MIEIRQRVGNQIHGVRSVEVKRPMDDIYDVVDGKDYCVAWSVRKPKGSPLVLFASMSESQIAESCKLLDERDGGEYPNRKIGDPPRPIESDGEDNEE